MTRFFLYDKAAQSSDNSAEERKQEVEKPNAETYQINKMSTAYQDNREVIIKSILRDTLKREPTTEEIEKAKWEGM